MGASAKVKLAKNRKTRENFAVKIFRKDKMSAEEVIEM